MARADISDSAESTELSGRPRGRRAGAVSRGSSAGTSMPYSLAAFSPRIFLLPLLSSAGSPSSRRRDSPSRRGPRSATSAPRSIVGAEQHLVLADPEQQLAHDLGEEPWPCVHQAADHHRKAGVDVGLLRRHEAEVLDPRQPDVLDDEVELRVVGRGVVDVAGRRTRPCPAARSSVPCARGCS